ncbi:hypothetical protein SASPL_148639 [Salvia splendens]|uniref:Uncharacterized protein n=1 Tax=Salvia splendens TaxID=180675 RepID=A0A8X8WB17_SALSN|nr:hypothetical protein SASPL_148639 [Salvia splendens]
MFSSMRRALLDCFIMLKEETHWSKTVFPSWFLLIDANWIKNKAGVIFFELELKNWVDLLRKWYYTFKSILCIRGLNLPLIPKALTYYRMHMNSFAGAYFYQEEPMYARLACMFRFDDVKVKEQKEVIVISDNTEETHHDDIITNDLVEGEEEVNSPVCSLALCSPQVVRGRPNAQ